MKSVILLPIIVVVVVAAVVVIQVTGVNPFQKPAEGGVVEIAMTELLDTKTFKVDGEIKADIKISTDSTEGGDVEAMLPGLSSVKVSVDVLASVDQRKKDDLKVFSAIDLGIDAGGMALVGAIEAMAVDDGFYVRLVSVPTMLSAFLGDIESIKNQWIKIDLGDIKNQYIDMIDQDGTELDEEEITQQFKDLVDEMKGLLKGKTLFDIAKRLGQEEIKEISTEHYFVTANKDAVKEFIFEYAELTKKYVPKEQRTEYDKKLEEAMQGFDKNYEEFWASIDGIEFDIWVEKRTGRLVRIVWKKDVASSSVGNVAQEIENVSLDLDVSFFDFNKNVDIKPPSEHKPLEEILSGIMSTFIPSGLPVPELSGD